MIAGFNTWASVIVPSSLSSVSQPWTVPGTDTENAASGPSVGMAEWPRRTTSSLFAAAADLPLPFSARTRFSSAFHTRANMSPPTPVDIGSRTLSAAAVATAASMALPPSLRICNPAWAASG